MKKWGLSPIYPTTVVKWLQAQVDEAIPNKLEYLKSVLLPITYRVLKKFLFLSMCSLGYHLAKHQNVALMRNSNEDTLVQKSFGLLSQEKNFGPVSGRNVSFLSTLVPKE